MKIVVIGGTGLIGSKVVTKLAERGHEAIPASPRLGINTVTGEGLAEALEGASVVVDVSNSPNFEYATALEFFQASTRNLLAADAAAGVGHHVALSVVGTKDLSEGGDPATTTAATRALGKAIMSGGGEPQGVPSERAGPQLAARTSFLPRVLVPFPSERPVPRDWVTAMSWRWWL